MPHSVLWDSERRQASARSGLRTFKTKPFARFADREGLEDAALRDAVRRAGRGSIDADLGGGVIKQRIARGGQGRSGGFRAIVLFRRGARAFFVYGFAKSDRENLRRDELKAFRLLAGEMLELNEASYDVHLRRRPAGESGVRNAVEAMSGYRRLDDEFGRTASERVDRSFVSADAGGTAAPAEERRPRIEPPGQMQAGGGVPSEPSETSPSERAAERTRGGMTI